MFPLVVTIPSAAIALSKPTDTCTSIPSILLIRLELKLVNLTKDAAIGSSDCDIFYTRIQPTFWSSQPTVRVKRAHSQSWHLVRQSSVSLQSVSMNMFLEERGTEHFFRAV